MLVNPCMLLSHETVGLLSCKKYPVNHSYCNKRRQENTTDPEIKAYTFSVYFDKNKLS